MDTITIEEILGGGIFDNLLHSLNDTSTNYGGDDVNITEGSIYNTSLHYGADLGDQSYLEDNDFIDGGDPDATDNDFIQDPATDNDFIQDPATDNDFIHDNSFINTSDNVNTILGGVKTKNYEEIVKKITDNYLNVK